MHIDAPIIYLFAGIMITLQGWILRELINLGRKQAVLENEIDNMKTHLIAAKLLIVVLAFLGAMTGCALAQKTTHSVADLFTKPVSTNVYETTNIVAKVSAEPHLEINPNGQGSVTTFVMVTNFVPVVIEHTNVVYAESTLIKSAENVGGFVAPFVPPPYGTILTAALGGLAGFAGWLAKKRSGQAASAMDLADTALATTKAVIKGVESFTKTGLQTPGNVKDFIQTEATKAGVQDDLHAIVKATT